KVKASSFTHRWDFWEYEAIRCRTNWWVRARLTPSAAKVKLACSKGDQCPMLMRLSSRRTSSSLVRFSCRSSTPRRESHRRAARATVLSGLGVKLISFTCILFCIARSPFHHHFFQPAHQLQEPVMPAFEIQVTHQGFKTGTITIFYHLRAFRNMPRFGVPAPAHDVALLAGQHGLNLPQYF